MRRCVHFWRPRFVYFADGSRCCVKCACKRFARRATARLKALREAKLYPAGKVL